MTDVTYTAWDDNQYQWPPPDGWYEATDGKWWPEGYGPPAAESSELLVLDEDVGRAVSSRSTSLIDVG